MKVLRLVASCLLALLLITCEEYDFQHVPEMDLRTDRLRFVVQQPSHTDFLFVIDNSGSMGPRQAALKSSLDAMLQALAPQSTSYRIGITTTDVQGASVDCFGTPISSMPGSEPSWVPGAFANCGRPDVLLRRPHDGTLGRLMAAYDPIEFDPDDPRNRRLQKTLTTPEQKAAFLALRPTGPSSGPLGLDGERGARWVIDRDIIQAEACGACRESASAGVCAAAEDGTPAVCVQGSDCFDNCAGPVAAALVASYFLSNMNGLGIDGSGKEQGLAGATLAIGIDAALATDAAALAPISDLTRVGSPNSYVVPTNGESFPSPSTPPSLMPGSWIREEALLAILIVSDEQDCSFPPATLASQAHLYEEDASPPQPSDSLCYQHGQNGLPDPMDTLAYDPQRIASLIAEKKGSAAKVAVGYIGALRQAGAAPTPDRDATPADCVSTSRVPLPADGQPSSDCTCFLSSPPEDREAWCQFTQDTIGFGAGLPTCDALAGSRYVAFASQFERRTFDSICRSGPYCSDDGGCPVGQLCFENLCVQPCNVTSDCGVGSICVTGECQRTCTTSTQCQAGRTCADGSCAAGFGLELRRFADVTALNCFALAPELTPLNGDPHSISVSRASRAQAAAGGTPVPLPMVTPGHGDAGWYYEAASNSVCLVNVERDIGDVYEITVVMRDLLDDTK